MIDPIESALRDMIHTGDRHVDHIRKLTDTERMNAACAIMDGLDSAVVSMTALRLATRLSPEVRNGVAVQIWRTLTYKDFEETEPKSPAEFSLPEWVHRTALAIGYLFVGIFVGAILMALFGPVGR